MEVEKGKQRGFISLQTSTSLSRNGHVDHLICYLERQRFHRHEAPVMVVIGGERQCHIISGTNLRNAIIHNVNVLFVSDTLFSALRVRASPPLDPVRRILIPISIPSSLTRTFSQLHNTFLCHGTKIV